MRKNRVVVRYICIALTVVLSSLFFIGIYFTNNKYTQKSIQPINGMLILSENDLADNSAIFLIRGWSFYPNTLLTPEKLKSSAAKSYSTFVSIGENTGLTDENGVTPHGCGTYVLRLSLPETPATYGIYIPEIYSSYRLYIDDEELLSLGTPEKEHYKSKTANRLITFDHSGGDTVTVMIAVNNESYIYGGMVYPPAFGTPMALNYQRGINLGINLAIISIVLFIMFFCLFFTVKMKNQNTVIYTLICLLTIIFIGYPIIHTFFALPVFPWYAIETTAGYAVIFMIILLHNRICMVNNTVSVISEMCSLLFCILILLYSLSASLVSGVIIDIVSYVIFAYKLSSAAYLLITGRHCANQFKETHKPLFYASLIYAVSCVWDRILPMFEPIYGGRFIEYGSLVLVFSIGYMLFNGIVESYSYNMAFAEEHKQMVRRLTMQTEYSAQIKEQYDEKRRLIHDFRQHIRVISGMIKSDGNDELNKYLSQLSFEFSNKNSQQTAVFCDNAALDALIRYYAGVTAEKGIDFQSAIVTPKSLQISDVDLCTVLGNLIENAVEACDNQTVGEKSISINSVEKGSNLFIVVRNTFNGEIRKNQNSFMSSKRINRPGIGIASSVKIISENNGSINITNTDDKFQVGITLPLKSD